MRIDQITKYKCNGCGSKAQNPIKWVSVAGLMAGGFPYTVSTGAHQSEDYCSTCIDKMRRAVKHETTTA